MTHSGIIESGPQQQPNFLMGAVPFCGPVTDYAEMLQKQDALANQGLCKTK